ncbi:MAG: BatD family protein [Dysgonamonadaceae bacterium]|jgi:hypothetical protein|nr:BatD family protein [Dysgonamonadaceae bacterium]
MKQKILLCWISLLSTPLLWAADITFKASAPGTVAVGEQFRLSYTLTNASGKDLRVPEMSDFKIVYSHAHSKGTNMQIVGSHVESVTYETYTYILQAQKEGTFEIGPASIRIDNSTYQSNPLTINVIAAATAQSGGGNATQQDEETSGAAMIKADDIFIRAQISRNNVYENEGFLVTLKLYTRVNVTNLGNFKIPNFEGFIMQEVESPANISLSEMENYNGKTYSTGVIKQFFLFPQRSGKLTIAGGQLDTEVAILLRRARSFFDNDVYSKVKKTLNINPVTVDVKALPAGKPGSFAGAVGSYKITSSINKEKLKTNEAVTVKINISGTGNLKMIKNPEITFPNETDFEIYDPKVDLNTKVTTGGVSGTKTIEYLAIPRYAGDFTIPSVEFSYFDPQTKSYKKYATPEYKLQVEKGKGGEETRAVVNYSNKEDIKYLGKDIRYINTRLVEIRPKEDFFFGKISYMLFYLIPALLFAVFFFIYRKQIKENANIALMRTKKANKVAGKRLKIAGKLLKENNREAFYDEILRTLWGYLSDKLSIPVASLTKDNVENELFKYGADEILIYELMKILNTCEFARYAPSQGATEMDELYKAVIQAMNKMENTIKK